MALARGSRRDRTRVGNLQNWHPAACGDLNSANDNDMVTGDPPLSNRPVGLASSCHGCVLHRNARRPSIFVGTGSEAQNKKKRAVP